MVEQMLGVGDVAKRLRVRPAQITALYYENRLRSDLCPIISGCRIIPASYVPFIVMELRRKGISVREPVEETAGTV